VYGQGVEASLRSAGESAVAVMRRSGLARHGWGHTMHWDFLGTGVSVQHARIRCGREVDGCIPMERST